MSQLLGKELTEALLKRLSGQDVKAHEGKIIPIFTLDESGWPHPALLSYYEVVAQNSTTIDIAVWKNSSTARNLRQTNKVTFLIADKGVNYYLKGSVKELQTEIPGIPLQSRFRVTTEQLLEDQEPNAEITSGLTYSRRTERATTDHAVEVFNRLRGEP
jgi:Pyridoxamine 5'-phosphate oxidase